jgi:predicted metal-binding protein
LAEGEVGYLLFAGRSGTAGLARSAEEDVMSEKIHVGIIICDRYRTCAGGKCLRSLRQREGAFSVYSGKEVELVGYTTCDGCPGGNIEYSPEEMKKNGADVIHLATGLVVGYPPCPHLETFRRFIPEKYGIPVVIGTHPIPQKYFLTHQRLGTWSGPEWDELIAPTLSDEGTRLAYD